MCNMNQNWKYFGILLYILLNILNRYHCRTTRCYTCTSCPEINSEAKIMNNCLACSSYGNYPNIYRECLADNQSLNNFTRRFRKLPCFGDLCNGIKYVYILPSGKIQKNITCYACRECTESTQRIETSCGACATHLKPGYTDKYCLNSCDEAPDEQGMYCCTTDLCNGMTKLNFHGSAIIFILVLTGINVFIL